MNFPSDLIDHYREPVLKILTEHPLGLTEFQLLQQLESAGYPEFDSNMFQEHLTLFHSHFLLFHILYQISDFMKSRGEGSLEIHCLKIRIVKDRSLADESDSLALLDPLRSYYLNLENLKETTKEDVEELLNSFWKTFQSAGRRREALERLGLEDPVSHDEIKQRYRSLAMEHHPDRGGDVELLQEINEAMEILISNSGK